MGQHLTWLLLAWLAYFVIHSLLASLTVKHWVASRFPSLMPGYRLGFNFLALVLLAVPLWLLYANQGEWLIEWTGVWAWLANGLALLAVAGFFWSLSFYDGSEFLGLRQLRQQEKKVEDQENFHLSPLHRFVRHPWYFLGLVIVWTRDMDAGFLLSAALITLYFIYGSRLEEKKLEVYYGAVYREYKQKVPGLVPLPWRFLSRSQAESLLRQAREPFDQ